MERALAQGPLPRYTDLQEMEAQLLRQLERLLPLAEAGGAEPAVLDAVRTHMRDDMGSGLMSARIHVRQLAQDARALLRYALEGRP